MPFFSPRKPAPVAVEPGLDGDEPVSKKKLLETAVQEAADRSRELANCDMQISQAKFALKTLEQLRAEMTTKEFEEANMLGVECRRLNAQLDIQIEQVADLRRDAEDELSRYLDAAAADNSVSEAANERIRRLNEIRAALQSAKTEAAMQDDTEQALHVEAIVQAEDSVQSLRDEFAQLLSEDVSLAAERSALDGETVLIRARIAKLAEERLVEEEAHEAQCAELQEVERQNEELRERVRVARAGLDASERVLSRLGGNDAQAAAEIRANEEQAEAIDTTFHLETGRVLPTLDSSRLRKRQGDEAHARRQNEMRAAAKMRLPRGPDASLSGLAGGVPRGSLGCNTGDIVWGGEAAKEDTPGKSPRTERGNATRFSTGLPCVSLRCAAPVNKASLRDKRAPPWDVQLQEMLSGKGSTAAGLA